MATSSSHDPPFSIKEQPLLVEIYNVEDVPDDMFNYQRALLDYGMVIMNFLDAISEWNRFSKRKRSYGGNIPLDLQQDV